MDAAPMICHARTRDGIRIAYQSLGTGPTFVLLFPYHVNDLILNWAVPVHREAMRVLAGSFSVINLNFRGAGQSERDIESLTLDVLADDIRAVLEDIGAHGTTICAMGNAAPIAAHLARASSDTVSRLILLEAGESETSKRLFALRLVNPTVGADMRASAIAGVADPENTPVLAEVMRNAVSPAAFALFHHVLTGSPLEDQASDVETPTLVVHASDDELIPLDVARQVAGSMKNAHLMVVPATSGFAVWKVRGALERIVAFAQGRWSGDPNDPPPRSMRRSDALDAPAGLTAREREVLLLVASGKTNQQIGATLFISLNTVSHHLRSIFAKTGSANRTEAAAFAHRNGIRPTA